MNRASRAVAHCLPGMLLVAALQLPASAAPAPPSAPEEPASAWRPQRCEPARLGRDTLSVVCALDGAAAPQRVHVKLHLTGSHDDTTATLDVALGDAPVACESGSKTSTEGEDGDVTLDCRFTAAVGPGPATALRVAAKWFHAQYVGLEVEGRRP